MLRTRYLAKRAALDKATVQLKSAAIVKRLLPYVKGKAQIGFYMAFRNEVDLSSLYDCLHTHTQFAVPRVCTDTQMEFVRYHPQAQLVRSRFGIWEPSDEVCIAPNELSVILVPLVVFHPSGLRIGYGKGYYDRYLANCNVQTIGVAYEFQRCDEIIAQSHDVLLDLIITEERCYSSI